MNPCGEEVVILIYSLKNKTYFSCHFKGEKYSDPLGRTFLDSDSSPQILFTCVFPVPSHSLQDTVTPILWKEPLKLIYQFEAKASKTKVYVTCSPFWDEIAT